MVKKRAINTGPVLHTRQQHQPDLSIVIPAYHEEKRIGATLDNLARLLRTDGYLRRLQVEVLVVAADAADKTADVVEAKRHLFRNLQLLQPGRRAGKGRDVKFGMQHACGKAICFMDADMATPLHYIVEFHKRLDTYDIVVGLRNLKAHHPSAARRMVSNTGNALFRAVSGLWITDSQCGFKMFTAAARDTCFSRQTLAGWGFDMEILAIAKLHGLRIHGITLHGWQSVPGGSFDGNLVANVASNLRDLAIIFVRRIRGDYTRK